MSEIRDKARKVLDLWLPPGKIIYSNGPTAQKYTQMTNITQKQIEDSWKQKKNLTGCNGFTGWYSHTIGLKKYFGAFGFKKQLLNEGRLDAWVGSITGDRPKYGDIIEYVGLHVDVALDFDGEYLWRATAGWGGIKIGYDTIRRVREKFEPKTMKGWIDIAIYAGEEYGDIL